MTFTPPTTQEVKAFIKTPHLPFRFKVHIHAGYDEDVLKDGGEEARVVLDLRNVDYYFAGDHFCCMDLVDKYREWREEYGDKYYSRLIFTENVKTRRNGHEYAKVSPRFPLCFA